MLLQYSTTVVSAGTTDNKTLGDLTFFALNENMKQGLFLSFMM